MCVDLGISRVRGLFRKCFRTNSEVIFSFGFFVKRQVLSLREWPGLLVQVCLRFTGVSCLFVERAGSQVCRELSGGFVRERDWPGISFGFWELLRVNDRGCKGFW